VAATVICIRRARHATPPLTKEEATGNSQGAGEHLGGDGPARINLVFGQSNSTTFAGGWEVLLGQSEVQNWVKSSPERIAAMRYPGEWKFAGGGCDPGETPEAAAKRELSEEFLIELPEDPSKYKFHLLSIKQTRPIRNVSNIMYNFVAAAEENEWLENLDVDRINTELAARRARHADVVADGSFWSMDKETKERVSPEIRQVQWLDMRSAILHSFTSMNKALTPVNKFQEQEFLRLNIKRRDPMFLTMATMLEVESFPSIESLQRYSHDLTPDEELKRSQWLYEGMSPEEVKGVWDVSNSPTESGRRGMFGTAEEMRELRLSRVREDTKRNETAKL